MRIDAGMTFISNESMVVGCFLESVGHRMFSWDHYSLCLFREDSCPNQSFVLGFLGLQEYDLQGCAKPPSSLSASCRLWAMPTLFEFAKINILTKTPMLQKDRWQYSPKIWISLEQFTRPSLLGKSVEIHRRGRRNMFRLFYMLCFLWLLLDVF